MATASFFTLFDDIASVLDDVAAMTKVAARKTAGVLGDDLALNAQQVTGVAADRELPIVWAVAKGSAWNKLILVPAALAISAIFPWLITPLMMIGGAYLCFEGCEKLAHRFLHSHEEDQKHHAEHLKALIDEEVDIVAMERDKIRGAIRTDFILSAEIIVISLGTVAAAAFPVRLGVLVGISAIMTIGVYGLVAMIVKLDDAGVYLHGRDNGLLKVLGRAILSAAPLLMKALSIVGTAAMFLVGGGILAHGLPMAHHVIHEIAHALHFSGGLGQVLDIVVKLALEAFLGIIVGAIVLIAVEGFGRLRGTAAH